MLLSQRLLDGLYKMWSMSKGKTKIKSCAKFYKHCWTASLPSQGKRFSFYRNNMGLGGFLCRSAICTEPGYPDIRVTDNYPCQDILIGAPVIVSSPMSNLRHKNGVGVERRLISINRYLHLTVCSFLKTNWKKKAKSSEEEAGGCSVFTMLTVGHYMWIVCQQIVFSKFN